MAIPATYDEFLDLAKDAAHAIVPNAEITTQKVEKLQGESYVGLSVRPERSNAAVTMNLRGMFEEDASAVTYQNFAAFSAGEENDIHRHLCAESQFVHGVCARRNNLSLVTFGNSLGNLIKTGIDDTQSQVRVCFRVAIDTPCHANDAALICQSFKCFLHRDSCPILRKTRRGEYSSSSAFSNRVKYLIVNRLHIIYLKNLSQKYNIFATNSKKKRFFT